MADEIEDQIEAMDEAIDETQSAEETTESEGSDAPNESETEETSPGEGQEEEAAEGEGGEEEESEEEAHKPALKFKAGVYNKETRALEQKEFDIDPRFHEVMKDPEAEKLVRELHEKAYGLESVKERFNESKQQMSELVNENREIKTGIDGLRSTYQTAVKTGNLHKLDSFFNTLQIPQEVILRYAMAKVELNEMDPAQRNAIMGQLQSEERAEALARQQEQLQAQNATQTQTTKALMVDAVLARTEVADLQKVFDERVGKPGAFKEAVYREGMLAWELEKTDLPPQEAVQRVIKNYGLNTPNHALARPETAANGASNGGKKVVKRTTATIPNVGGNSNSPLAKKPKNMEELLKYRKAEHGF